jgi:hypothetical protein
MDVKSALIVLAATIACAHFVNEQRLDSAYEKRTALKVETPEYLYSAEELTVKITNSRSEILHAVPVTVTCRANPAPGSGGMDTSRMFEEVVKAGKLIKAEFQTEQFKPGHTRELKLVTKVAAGQTFACKANRKDPQQILKEEVENARANGRI